jgi:hypothetical protein
MPSNLGIPQSSERIREAERDDSLAESKSKPGLLHSFSEVLSLDSDITNGKDILRNKAFHGTGAVLDGERRTIGLV